MWDVGRGASCSGFRVWILAFRACGLEFRVSGLGLRTWKIFLEVEMKNNGSVMVLALGLGLDPFGFRV